MVRENMDIVIPLQKRDNDWQSRWEFSKQTIGTAKSIIGFGW